MINKSDSYALILHLFGVILGLIGCMFSYSNFYHVFYVISISCVLILTVIVDGSGWIRPYSYLMLSFFIFVWMRYIINIFDGSAIISVGNGITNKNTNIVSVWLGVAINIICLTAIITSQSFYRGMGGFFEGYSKFRTSKLGEKVVLMASLAFFIVFLVDSVRKVNIVQMHDYLNVSETILVQGYRWFSLGKWLLLIWIIISRDTNKFSKGSAIIAVAGIGYLMRGARGYAIMYMFLWLLFYSQKRKIKLVFLLIIGVGLLYLANFILSYRMGLSVASGSMNIIKSVLYQQGASVEPVFGSVIFRDQIKEYFSPIDLFLRNDFGIFVDRIRGVPWVSGGFGSSFFAESYFWGFPLNIVFLVIVGMCVGFVECAFRISSKKYRIKKLLETDTDVPVYSAEFANIILFMTIPNLVYLGRSSFKDFMIKTIMVVAILAIIRGRTFKCHKRGDCNAK